MRFANVNSHKCIKGGHRNVLCSFYAYFSEWGYKTINTVWDRPGADESMKKLKELGADYVFTDDEFAKEGKKVVKGLKAPIKLALNGVGGPSVQKITSVLAKGASVVTYGSCQLYRILQ